MQNTNTSQQKIRRLVLDAMLVALYVVFSTVLSFKTPWFEVSLVGLPILLSARLFGMQDALVIAAVGSFLEQLMSPYGLSATTPLWMAPVVLMAACAALGFFFIGRRDSLPLVLGVIILSELLLTVFNTAALYLDGYIMNYAVKALHLIALPRIINSGVRMVLSCVLVPLLIPPIRRLVGKTK
jgi:ECF transporter S component (folate family)